MEWEYKVFSMRTEGFWGGKVDTQQLETLMNSLGHAGWELTTAFGTNEGYGRSRDVVVLLKREKKPVNQD